MSTTTVRPTKKQRELLTFIEGFIGEHGYSPSYREIMSGLSYTSVATVALHVNNLISRGHLRKRDHSARSIEVVKGPANTSEAPKVMAKDEKWLVTKVEAYFLEAESANTPSQDMVDNLYVLIGALKVLGMNEAVRGFIPRLTSLQNVPATVTIAE